MPARILSAPVVAGLAIALCWLAVTDVKADSEPGGSADSGGNAYTQGVTSGASVDGSDVTVNAGLTQGTGGGTAPTTVQAASAPVCSSQPVDPVAAFGLINRVPDTSITMTGDPGHGPGTWYVITCPGTTPSLLFAGSPPVGPQSPLAQPSALAQQALATMHLPGPAVGMSPPSNSEVVNFADWLWVDPATWHPISATATAGPVSATATATPDRVVYDMGDGSSVVCNGPGTLYDPTIAPDRQTTKCSHAYLESSAGQPTNRYTVSATIYWSVRWTSQGAAGGGSLGEVRGATTSTPVEVDEIQAVTTTAR